MRLKKGVVPDLWPTEKEYTNTCNFERDLIIFFQ